MYGRVMSISDMLMLEYYDLLNGGSWNDLRELRKSAGDNGRDRLTFKHELALRLVARFHGDDEAKRAREHFQRVVQRKEVPDEVQEWHLPVNESGGRGLLDILEALGMAKSRSDARRLVSQQAVSVDGARVDDVGMVLRSGSYLIQVGKRRFARLTLGEPQDASGSRNTA
jgi:tyrosyl-tRNA synthetase